MKLRANLLTPLSGSAEKARCRLFITFWKSTARNLARGSRKSRVNANCRYCVKSLQFSASPRFQERSFSTLIKKKTNPNNRITNDSVLCTRKWGSLAWLLQARGAGNMSFSALLMQPISSGVLKVTKEKETKSPLLAHTERTAGKPWADGLEVQVDAGVGLNVV